LLVREWAAELVPCPRPLGGLVTDLARPAQHPRRERAPPVVQAREGDVQAAAFLPEQVALGDLDVGEADPRLPRAPDAALAAVLREDVDPFHGRGAHGRGPLLLAVGHFLLGHDGENAREGPGRGPLLLTVEDVVLTVGRLLAPGLLPAGVA